MKTVQAQHNEATDRINWFAQKLRDLVQEAASEGVLLAIPDTALKAEFAKRNDPFTQYRAVAAIPAQFEHKFFNEPGHVIAAGIIGKDDLGNPQIVRPNDLRHPNFPIGFGQELYDTSTTHSPCTVAVPE